MRTLNLGILAHVDAGKTTLSERLLFTAGAIDHVGTVDAGTTQTDSLDLERERGITIRSAVASFLVGDLAVNLVDTPGHPDFIAEVERVLGVLDGAVLVVSAVEGVQPQTPLLFRALQRLHVPTLIFVNKIDRPGADPDRVVGEMRRRLAPALVPMERVRDAGRRTAVVEPFGADDTAHSTSVTELLAEHDDAILAAYLGEDRTLPYPRLREQLAAQTRRGRIHPVFFGSAGLGIGVDVLLAGIRELLQGPGGDPDAPVSGRVFKIERTAAGERVAYVRLFAGTLRPRDRVRIGEGNDAKPNAIRVFAPAGAPRRDTIQAGEMATVRGLGGVRVGDAIGEPPPGEAITARFPRPTLEAVVVARSPEQSGSLRAALAQLAEQDPLIDVRQDDARHEIAVSLYGEVQKEVIQATLERDFGVMAEFRETTVVCIERPARVGEAKEIIRAKTKTNITGRSSPLSTNPFLATLALRIEPASPGTGIEFRHDVEVRLVPLYLFHTVVCIERPARVGEAEEIIRAKTKTNITGRSSPLSTNPFLATLALRVEPAPPWTGIEFRHDVEVRLVPLYLFHTVETFATQMAGFVREALTEGLAGWQVTDCVVTMTDCGYLSPTTSPADFRRLTQLVLATALERAGTWVCEPLADLGLEMPASTAPGVLAALGRLGGRVRGQFSANGLTRADAVLPVARVRSLQNQLPGLSMGEGILETRFGGYQPVGDNPPRRPRSSPSPVDRDAWLASLAKRG